MKHLIILSAFFLIAFNAYPQEENSIKFGSEATLTLIKNASGGYTYKITAVKKFHKAVDLDDNDLLSTAIDTNQVKLYFCRGGYGGLRDETLLIIESGLKTPLKYIAKTRITEKDPFESTSVGPLLPNVKTVETWHYPFEAILLGNFSKTKP